MRQNYNPYLPLNEYVPDGEPHVFGDRVYIFGSHDAANGMRYCEKDYTTWSAPVSDPTNWSCAGTIYERTQDPSNADGSMQLWAPDITQGPDGRYYLYYCFSFYPEFGVAVSDAPDGKFEFYGHVRYPEDLGGESFREDLPFDPAVLRDDDGRIYLYYGFSPIKDMTPPDPEEMRKSGASEEILRQVERMRDMKFSRGGMVVELEPDMLTVKSAPRMVIPGGKIADGTGFEGHGYYEAPSIRKVNGKYYLVYSSQNSHELCYAVSDHPTDGFVYGGTIISNGDLGQNGRTTPSYTLSNNHGGLVQIGDDWYIFYHRATNGTEASRQGWAEKITVLADGTIPQVRMTSMGIAAQPIPAQGTIPASICAHMTCPGTMDQIDYRDPAMREQTMISQEGEKQYVHQIMNGTILGYKDIEFAGATVLKLKARGMMQGRITASADEQAQIILGIAETTFRESDWKEIEVALQAPNGAAELFLHFAGEVALDIESITFE